MLRVYPDRCFCSLCYEVSLVCYFCAERCYFCSCFRADVSFCTVCCDSGPVCEYVTFVSYCFYRYVVAAVCIVKVTCYCVAAVYAYITAFAYFNCKLGCVMVSSMNLASTSTASATVRVYVTSFVRRMFLPSVISYQPSSL